MSINAITIDRETGNGKYADVLDVCETLGNTDYGSASNALLVMIRQSRLFQRTLRQMQPTDNIPAHGGDGGTES